MSKICQASINRSQAAQEMLRQVAECLPRSTLNSWPVESRLMSKAPTVSFVTSSVEHTRQLHMYSMIRCVMHPCSINDVFSIFWHSKLRNTRKQHRRCHKIPINKRTYYISLLLTKIYILLWPVMFVHSPCQPVISCSYVSGTTCSRGDDFGTASGSRRPKQSFSKSA